MILSRAAPAVANLYTTKVVNKNASLLFVPVVFSLVHGREKNRAAAGETSHVV